MPDSERRRQRQQRARGWRQRENKRQEVILHSDLVSDCGGLEEVAYAPVYDLYSPASFSVTLMRILTTAVTRRSSLKSPHAPSIPAPRPRHRPSLAFPHPRSLATLSIMPAMRVTGPDSKAARRDGLGDGRGMGRCTATIQCQHFSPPPDSIRTSTCRGYLVYTMNVVDVSHATSSRVRCSQHRVVAGLGAWRSWRALPEAQK
ncbi:hypothetical protein DFP72DRAFT_896192 [Ephemerocybe angulata]|uniref:Uncharacterized protein n=1 Tax=Ephemerocybe angulata TaxID=980116 RepID=A0A8H6I1I1_9AGAR|nr:hypothetical protein DFP72DRAFT_896192 [Tulosesus angulatus]